MDRWTEEYKREFYIYIIIYCIILCSDQPHIPLIAQRKRDLINIQSTAGLKCVRLVIICLGQPQTVQAHKP